MTTHTRLAFARHLLLQAEQQLAALPEPLRSSALLSVHDAIELFLHLASEHLNVRVGDQQALGAYFEPINRALAPNALPHTESLKRLNKARVSLKHYGTHPSSLDLGDFASIGVSFLTEATPLVFGVPLATISLAAAVQWSGVREALVSADNARSDGNLKDALVQLGLAFEHLLLEATRRELDALKRPYLMRPSRLPDDFPKDVLRLLEDLQESTDLLYAQVATLRLGIDAHELARFKRLVPEVALAPSGANDYWNQGWPPPTNEAFAFGYSFVLRNALRLQETFPLPPADG